MANKDNIEDTGAPRTVAQMGGEQMSEDTTTCYTVTILVDVWASSPREAMERFMEELMTQKELADTVFTVYRRPEEEDDPVAESIHDLPEGSVWHFLGGENVDYYLEPKEEIKRTTRQQGGK